MKVVVTSNCQTAGIANGLTMLLPGSGRLGGSSSRQVSAGKG